MMMCVFVETHTLEFWSYLLAKLMEISLMALWDNWLNCNVIYEWVSKQWEKGNGIMWIIINLVMTYKPYKLTLESRT